MGVNGEKPAKQVYKIWRKHFQALLSNRILDVGAVFIKSLPVHCMWNSSEASDTDDT